MKNVWEPLIGGVRGAVKKSGADGDSSLTTDHTDYTDWRGQVDEALALLVASKAMEKMLCCGDIRQGFYEYYCQDCAAKTKVGFTCKCR